MILFDQVARDAKSVFHIKFWNLPSGGRAEIENIKHCSLCDTFNFSNMYILLRQNT